MTVCKSCIGDAVQRGADLERVGWAKERCPLVFCELQPGDAIFFHCNLLHTSDQVHVIVVVSFDVVVVTLSSVVVVVVSVVIASWFVVEVHVFAPQTSDQVHVVVAVSFDGNDVVVVVVVFMVRDVITSWVALLM